jgi:hypothetical protein
LAYGLKDIAKGINGSNSFPNESSGAAKCSWRPNIKMVSVTLFLGLR